MCRDVLEVVVDIGKGRRADGVNGGIDQPVRAVRREQAQRADVEVMAHAAVGRGLQGDFGSADDGADDFGGGRSIVGPCYDSAEGRGEGFVEDGVGECDGQEERCGALESREVVGGDEADVGLWWDVAWFEDWRRRR